MALITTLRNKMGKVVVFFVGFSIVTFVLTDFFNQNSTLFSQNDNVIGEIAGEEITRQEYNLKYDELRRNVVRQLGGQPLQAGQLDFISQQAWEQLFQTTAYQKEYDALGVVVTEEEVVDMVQGNNITEVIKSAPIFQDPNTGQFDVNRVRTYLQNLSTADASQREDWYQFERSLAPQRIQSKYQNLLVKTDYVTLEQAIQRYKEENTTADIKYAYVPYTNIPDSTVTVTDSEIREYTRAHASEYEVEESRDLKYVLVNVNPSPDDTAYFVKELENLSSEFGGTQNDSLFAKRNTERNSFQFYSQYNPKTLPKVLQDDFANLQVGDVIGPVKSLNGQYALYKVSEETEDTTNFYCSTSHILIKWDDESDAAKRDARRKAQDLIRQINNGADFGTLATENSADPGSARLEGVLGWISEDENYVQPYKDAAFGASTEGLIQRPVESTFGYHIIRIDHAKTNKAFKVASVVRDVTPLENTRNVAFRKADNFRAKVKEAGVDGFNTQANADSLTVYNGLKIDKNAKAINTLREARNVVTWLYRDATVGTVSGLFEVDGNYVVAVMTKETDKGLPDIEDVRARVTTKVRNEKKAELIKEKLAALNAGSIEDVVTGYGNGAQQYQQSGLKLNSTQLTDVGEAPEAVGAAFAQPTDKPGSPIAIDNGVVQIVTIKVNEAPEIADYNTYITQLQAQENNILQKIAEALREEANIVDMRYKFF